MDPLSHRKRTWQSKLSIAESVSVYHGFRVRQVLTDLVNVVVDEVALVLGHIQNSVTESSVHKQRLPACHGVGANDGMLRGEDVAHVQWVATLNVVADLDAKLFGFSVEELGIVPALERLEVSEERGGHFVENLNESARLNV